MKKFIQKLISYFLQGLLALLPLIIIGYIVFLLFIIIQNILDSIFILLPQKYKTIPNIQIILKSLTVFALLSTIFVTGVLLKTIIGRAIIKIIDSVINTIPGLNTIYRAVKQVVDIFFIKKHRFLIKPVLVEYPSQGIWVVAFITGEAEIKLAPNQKENFKTVFIPTTPNPTSGFLSIVPESRIKLLDISLEDAIKLVLTGGIAKS
jgi:uncharacterized membrane protein